jgi:hypothetical protein
MVDDFARIMLQGKSDLPLSVTTSRGQTMGEPAKDWRSRY